MNRELTKREKVLLLIFAVLLIAVGYYKLLLEPINNQIESYRSLTQEEQMQMETAQLQAVRMKQMEAEIAQAKAAGIERTIPDYDNSAVLLPQLYQIMDSTIEYAMDFDEITFEGNIAARPVQIEFETANYQKARRVIDKLCTTGYAMQIEDMTIQEARTTDKRSVHTYLSITFFEAVRQ